MITIFIPLYAWMDRYYKYLTPICNRLVHIPSVSLLITLAIDNWFYPIIYPVVRAVENSITIIVSIVISRKNIWKYGTLEIWKSYMMNLKTNVVW